MNKLDKIRNKWYLAQEKVESAHTELVNFVYPIIRILNDHNPGYSISNISVGKITYRIETVSADDPSAWKDYIIPIWIIEADDPLLAAASHLKTQRQEKACGEQLIIRREIERLEKLLK